LSFPVLLKSARRKAIAPSIWGAPGSVALDLKWDGIDGLVIDDAYRDRLVDPVTGAIAIARDSLVGRFVTVTGTVTLPAIGLAGVTTLEADPYYPPYIMRSGAMSVQVDR
jgi:hypothetical protein